MDGAEGADAHARAAVNRRGKAARSAWAIILVMLGALVAGIVTLATGAGATTLLSARLEASGTPGGTSMAGTTCSAAYTSLLTGTHNKARDLAIGPVGFPTITATRLTVTDGGTSACTTLTLEGTATVFSLAAKVLVVGQWTTSTATTPTFTIVFGFKTVPLSSLVAPTGSSFGVSLSHAWVATTAASAKVSITPASLPTGDSSFFTGLKGALTVASSGISFAGELTTTGGIGKALTDLHIKNTGLQLTGSLSGSVGTFSATKAPAVTAKLQLFVSVTVTLTTPSWLSFPTQAFTLSISGTSSGKWSVTVTGKATLKLRPTTAATRITASFTITGSPTSVTVALKVQVGTIKDAFGLTWLKLTSTTLTWTISGKTATLQATVTVGTSPDTATLTATVKLGTGASATLSVTSTSHTLSTTNLAKALGGFTLPTTLPTVSLKHLAVYLDVPKSGSVTVAAEATATITISSHSFTVSMLLRVEGTKVLVGARTSTALHLKTFVSGLPTAANVSLTDLAVLFSTSSVSLKSTAIDTATKTFFQPLYCSTGKACTFTVAEKSGVTIQAAVGLPTTLKKLVCKLVNPTKSTTTTCLTGPVTISGHIPLFKTAKTVSLSIALPTVEISHGPVRQLKLSVSISATKTTFTLSISGGLVLLAPSAEVTTGPQGCPASVTRPKTDVCLTLTVSGKLKIGTTGLSITLTASLKATTGWRLPNPVTWLTLDSLVVQIGLTVGETGPGVTFGIAGTFKIGSTTFAFAVHLKATPEAPWLDLLGVKLASTEGIGTSTLTALYHDVTGNTLPSALPKIRLRDLLLEYSVTTDKTLGLCQGLHISADLTITGDSWTQKTYPSPTKMTCTAAPPMSTVCKTNKGSCLASIFLSISKNGFVGKGHITTWSAGPLYFTATTLDVTITTSEVQVHIKAGGKLLTPFTWATEKTQAPEWFGGTITLTVGTTRLYLSATGDIGTLSATISGTASFSTLANAGFTLSSWFTTVKTAFVTAGNHVASAMKTVGTTVTAWWQTYVATSANQVAGDIQAAFNFLGSTGPPAWQKIEAVFAVVTTAISKWNNAVNSVSVITLHWLDITASAIFQDVLHGIKIGGYTVCIIKCFLHIPGVTIPGVCTYANAVQGTPLCSASTLVSGAQSTYANPNVRTHLTAATLSLPPGATDKTLITKLHRIDPPTGTTSLTCAMATEDFNTKYESPTIIQVKTLGNNLTINGPQPNTLGNPTDTTSNDKVLGQNTLNGLYSGTNQGTCTQAPAAKPVPTTPAFTLGLTQSWVYEGGTVTVGGTAGTGISQVTITWGDGSSSTTATLTTQTHTYRASHVYADETGVDGEPSPFTVTATPTVGSGFTAPATATGSVAVYDAPLALTSFTAAPTTPDVMQTVTASGRLSAPVESGEPVTATITWGDGADTTVTVASTGSFSATHVYDRLTPIGKPVAKEPITVALSEGDGTTTSGSSSVTLHDVAPTGLISPTTGAVVTSGGTVFTHAGAPVGWTSEVTDVSPAQGITFSFDWNDGTPNGVAIVGAPTPSRATSQNTYTYPVPTGSVTHTFASACLYTVTTTATDDDTLATSLTVPVVVTAPLGADPAPTADWLRQLSAGRPAPPPGRRIPAKTLGCYLEIAQHLSPELGRLTPAAAASILGPGGPAQARSQSGMLEAQLRRELLTVLLDFANGSWNWTQEIALAPTSPRASGQPHEATLEALVGNANLVLTSEPGTVQALQAALGELRQAQVPQPPPLLSWSPSTDGVYSFGTVNVTTTVSETFTVTSPGPNGQLRPLPPDVPVALTGSTTAFTVTATTCPAGPASPTTSPPPSTCTVTVAFTPKATDTPDSATLTATAGPTPHIASLVLTGTGDLSPSIAITFSPASGTGSCQVDLILTDFKPTTHYVVTYSVTSSGSVTGSTSYAPGVTTNSSGGFSESVFSLSRTDSVAVTVGGVTTPFTKVSC